MRNTRITIALLCLCLLVAASYPVLADDMSGAAPVMPAYSTTDNAPVFFVVLLTDGTVRPASSTEMNEMDSMFSISPSTITAPSPSTTGSSGMMATGLVTADTTSGTTTSDTNSSASGQTYYVNITNYAFSNPDLSINAGDTVVWTNQDAVAHTVTSVVNDTGLELDSPQLSTGQSYTHTFATNGVYDYHCTIHSTMQGRVTVG